MANLHLTAILNRVKQDEKWKLPLQKNFLHLPKVGKSSHTIRRHSSSARCSVTTPKSQLELKSPSSNALYLGTPLRATKSTPRKKPKDKTPKTPTESFDRFIPSRSSTNTEMAHYMIVNNENLQQESGPKLYSEKLNSVLFNGLDPSNAKVLSFAGSSTKKSACRKSLEELYISEGKDKQKSDARQIYPHPDRILDAPDLIDNFYLNLLDWSPKNLLCVALYSSCHLLDMDQSTVQELINGENNIQDDYISSLSFDATGDYIGIGDNGGNLQLWDVQNRKLLRTMSGHYSSLHSLSWNANIITCGTYDGCIYHHDVRLPRHCVGTLYGHSSIVCGLTWSPDNLHLASGGNDNIVNIWDLRQGPSVQPLHSFASHTAAVKALAWCPWQPYMLASGGGTTDKTIRLWNIQTGRCTKSQLTHSQISSLLWSKEHREIVTGHGFTNNSLSFWKFPNLECVGELKGHSARILNLSLAPNGSTVASLGADETIRLWKCFSDSKKASIKPSRGMFSGLR